MLTLYYAPGACSLAAHIVLEEGGEKYEAKKMDLSKGEQRTPEYLKIHPLARGLREMRAQRAEESAEKMSVKLMFPMVLFIFPALLLVMVGPAVLQLVKVIGAP